MNGLLEAIDGARAVEVDHEWRVVWCWFGGTICNAYNADDGTCLDCFTISDDNGEPCGAQTYVIAMRDRIADGGSE